MFFFRSWSAPRHSNFLTGRVTVDNVLKNQFPNLLFFWVMRLIHSHLSEWRNFLSGMSCPTIHFLPSAVL